MVEHPNRRGAVSVLLALAGLAVAVVLSVAASNLSTQPIGISGEPLRAGVKLAPRDVGQPDKTTATLAKPKPKRKPKLAATGTTPAATPTTTSNGPERPGDDRGGRDNDHDDD